MLFYGKIFLTDTRETKTFEVVVSALNQWEACKKAALYCDKHCATDGAKITKVEMNGINDVMVYTANTKLFVIP